MGTPTAPPHSCLIRPQCHAVGSRARGSAARSCCLSDYMPFSDGRQWWKHYQPKPGAYLDEIDLAAAREGDAFRCQFHAVKFTHTIPIKPDPTDPKPAAVSGK